MASPTVAPEPALSITTEGKESPGSAQCFAAVRDLARLADAASQGVASPLVLRVRYAIDTPLALGANGVWRISSDWHPRTVTFQAVLRPEHVQGDEDAAVRRLLQGALSNAQAHAERTGLGSSLDGLARLVGGLTGGPAVSRAGHDHVVARASGVGKPERPAEGQAAGERRAWMATTLPTTTDRVAGWQQEFQARRRPQHLQQPLPLVTAFEVVAPRLPPALHPQDEYASLTVRGATGVLAAVRVPVLSLRGLPDELADVTSRLAFAQPVDSAAPADETPTEAALRPSAKRAEENDPPGPTARLVRFGVELGVHEDGSPDGRRVGVLVLLDDHGKLTRVAATSRQLAVLGFDLRSCQGLLERWRLGHHRPGRDPRAP